MTRWALAGVLWAAAAGAHTFAFDFITPSGAGTRTDGGVTVIQWVDGPDPNDLAKLTLYAQRNGIAPFGVGVKDAQYGPMGIPVSDPLNLAVWDATGLPTGCYQPFALMVDQIEGTTLRLSTGVVTVAPADGGNVPPALWVLNQPGEKPSDAGTLGLRIKIDDPDDRGTLAIRWSNGADAGGMVVSGLPVPDGGGTVTYAVDPRFLPPAQTYYFEAEVTSFDGQVCAVWWSGNVAGSIPAAPDAGGGDAGVDAGMDPSDGGPPVNPPRGCGCSAGGGPVGLLVLALLVRRRNSDARADESAAA